VLLQVQLELQSRLPESLQPLRAPSSLAKVSSLLRKMRRVKRLTTWQ
jgi:hypothetical protein